MAVPAHDTRDWEFAKKFGLPMIEVVAGGDMCRRKPIPTCAGRRNGQFSGFLERHERGRGQEGNTLTGLTEKRLRRAQGQLQAARLGVLAASATGANPSRWSIATSAAMVPVPEERAAACCCPNVEVLRTDGQRRESPLRTMTDWVNTTCPHCGGPAKRETDTMPQWAGSSWYFLRYCDPHNDKELASQGSA